MKTTCEINGRSVRLIQDREIEGETPAIFERTYRTVAEPEAYLAGVTDLLAAQGRDVRQATISYD